MQEIVQYTSGDGVSISLSPQNVKELLGVRDLPDVEVAKFLARCQASKLNPFAGDVHLSIFKGKVQAIVSKDYYVRTAQQQASFDGFKAGIIVMDLNQQIVYREGCMYLSNCELLLGGWAEVYDKGRTYPTRAEVALTEYNNGQALWKSKPATMIRKVALVQALRETYMNLFGHTYAEEEMPPADASYSMEALGGHVQEAPTQEPQAAPELEASYIEVYDGE